MTQVYQRTVLFADLRGSTSMYETLGNAEATTVVTRSVALLARVVEEHGGQVVKTLGDGLMAIFPEPSAAIQASDDMHDSLSRIGLPPASAPEAAELRVPPIALKLQVGLAHGEVVEMSGDVFGDAVNVAARLQDMTKNLGCEAIFSEAVRVTAGLAAESLPAQEVAIRGRSEPMTVRIIAKATILSALIDASELAEAVS
jgi:adenylate cyclase